MSSFVDATTPDADGVLMLDAAWLQGRGVYGGIPAGAMVRAMQQAVGDPARPIRSFTVHFCEPARVGPARVRAELVRAGGRVSHARAEVTCDGVVVAFSSASFCAARPVALAWDEVAAPEATNPDEMPSMPVAERGGPRFTRLFNYRSGGGDVVWSGATEARARTWIRPPQPAVVDAALVVGLLDAGPPALAVRDTGPRPVASVDFRVQFLRAFPLDSVDAEAWGRRHWLSDARARTVAEGYAEELTHLFAPDGRAVATCQQLIALLR